MRAYKQRAKRSLSDRFWEKVDKRGPDDCWEWIAGKSNGGYGVFCTEEGTVGAHSQAWKLSNGIIPEGDYVLHSCDNPGCCNNAHLFIGTQTENMQDCISKGRFSRGESNGQSKLNSVDVQLIRGWHESFEASREGLAKIFGVSKTTIGLIVRRVTWQHI